MISLVRRDGALRALPLWGVVLLLNASVLFGLMTTFAVQQRSPISSTATLMVGWLTVGLFLAVAGTRSRCGSFELALPISAPRLWLAHLAALTVAGLVMTLGYTAVLAAAAGVLERQLLQRPDLVGGTFLLGAATLLAAVLLQIPRPSLARVPLTAGRAAWTGFVVLALLGLLPLLATRATLTAPALLALAAVAAVWAHRRVPPAFTLVPREPGDDRAPDAASREGAEGRVGSARWTVWLAAMRCLSVGAKEWASYPFIALFGLVLGNALAAWDGGPDTRDLRFLYILLTTYMLYAFAAPRLGGLHRIDPLPISRRVLFAGLLLPSAIALVASYGVGALLATRYGERTEYVNFSRRERDGRWELTVPLRVYRVAWDGRVPDVTSPWGESHAPDREPLFRDSRAAAWSPYSAPAGSSARFVALQINRAAQAVYGISIPPDEIERRWLETLDDGTVAGRAASLPIRAQRTGLMPRSGPIFPVLMTLVLLPWLLLVAALLRAHRAGIAPWVRQALYWGGLGLLILPLPAQVGSMLTGLARPWLARALVEIPTWRMGQSALGTAAVWAGSILLLGGAYWLGQRQFARMEIPTKPVRYTLYERLRDGS